MNIDILDLVGFSGLVSPYWIFFCHTCIFTIYRFGRLVTCYFSFLSLLGFSYWVITFLVFVFFFRGRLAQLHHRILHTGVWSGSFDLHFLLFLIGYFSIYLIVRTLGRGWDGGENNIWCVGTFVTLLLHLVWLAVWLSWLGKVICLTESRWESIRQMALGLADGIRQLRGTDMHGTQSGSPCSSSSSAGKGVWGGTGTAVLLIQLEPPLKRRNWNLNLGAEIKPGTAYTNSKRFANTTSNSETTC